MTKEDLQKAHEQELLQVESNLHRLTERRKEIQVILLTLKAQVEPEAKKE